MAMSASLARRELDVQRYPLIVVVLVPLVAIFLQVLIPRFIPKFDILDLPFAGHHLFLGRLAQSNCRHHHGSGDRVSAGCADQPPPGNQRDFTMRGGIFCRLAGGQDRRRESRYAAADQLCLHLVEYRDLPLHHASHAGVQRQDELAA